MPHSPVHWRWRCLNKKYTMTLEENVIIKLYGTPGRKKWKV